MRDRTGTVGHDGPSLAELARSMAEATVRWERQRRSMLDRIEALEEAVDKLDDAVRGRTAA